MQLVQERGRSLPFVDCLVAASSGTARLTQEVGHPIVLLDIVADARNAIEKLRRCQHGCATLWPGSFQPLEIQSGWDDWDIFPVENILEGMDPACNAHIIDGVIRFPLPPGVALTEAAEQFSAALQHLRFQDIVRQPKWLESISETDPFANIAIFPRYTPSDPLSFRDAQICTDLFALDPTVQASLIFMKINIVLCNASLGCF